MRDESGYARIRTAFLTAVVSVTLAAMLSVVLATIFASGDRKHSDKVACQAINQTSNDLTGLITDLLKSPKVTPESRAAFLATLHKHFPILDCNHYPIQFAPRST